MRANSPAELFQRQHKLSQAASQFLETAWDIPFALKRGEHLVRAGERSPHLYFVEQGAFRIYIPKESGESSLGFGYSGTLLADFPSWVRQQATPYAIQALRKSQVKAIPGDQWRQALDQYPDLFKAWHQTMQQALLGMIDREVELLTFTPQQRLNRLLQRSPHIFQEVPQKYLASYLRMSPETLSRLLRKS